MRGGASPSGGMAKRVTLLGGRYEPLESIGVGGEGHVIRTFDHHHRRMVALKVRRVADPDARAAALAEARTMLTLEAHRNIAVIRDDFFSGSDHLIVMEHVDGEDLRARLRRGGTPGLPATDVLAWLDQVAAALDHMHSAATPVIHGDVKPANIVVSDEPRSRAVLVDFGATEGSSSTRRYAAPELASGVRTTAADVFALAATAYELLTGDAPAPGMPRGNKALEAGLATDPSRRPPSAGALLAALRDTTVPCGT